jgi:hypothetical protein
MSGHGDGRLPLLKGTRHLAGDGEVGLDYAVIPTCRLAGFALLAHATYDKRHRTVATK